MGMALVGVTHCRECHSPLKWNEPGICEPSTMVKK